MVYMLISFCTSISFQTYAEEIAVAETVEVSWYGDDFEGNPMGCPPYAPFRKDDPSIVAHRELDCGTDVKLTNPQDGTTHIVTVQDRGPVPLEREFDVSEAVAKKFGFIDAGTANLIATVLTNK